MNTIADKIKYALFIIVFTVSGFTMSKERLGGYFYYNSLNFQMFKMALVFFAVWLVTFINRDNYKKISTFESICINIIIAIYTFDYFVTGFGGNLPFYKWWWLATIFVLCFAYFIGSHFYETQNRGLYFRKFWISFLPTYLVSFFIVFIRTPADHLTTNFKIGKGMLQFIPYIIKHADDSEVLFNVIGNILFFVPVAFITKAIAPKIKTHQIMFIGVLIPFFVEGYQYIFKCGDVDVDDIIVNISGFILGLLLMKIDYLILDKVNHHPSSSSNNLLRNSG